MMEGCYYEPAISHLKKALELDTGAWVAKEGLARCLAEQGLYGEAIEWQKKAIDSLPSNLSYLASYLYPRIADWRHAIGDHEGAFEAARLGYNADLGSPLAQLRYVEALNAMGSFDAIIEVINELDGWCPNDKDYSFLVLLFMRGEGVYHEIGKACRARGKPEFVLAAMDETLALSNQSGNEYMQLWLPAMVAAFRYDYYDQVQEPMQLWETTIKQIDTADSAVQKEYAKTRKTYSNRLAQLYFDAAIAARKAGPNLIQYVTKLKGLSVVTETGAEDDGDDDAFDFYGTGYASMLWGRWLREYENVDEAEWRKCFKARALEEMDMLDDNDPSNDTRGLHALGVTLLQAGDRTNAGAVLAILFKPLEDLLAQEVVTSDKSGPLEDEDDENDSQHRGVGDAEEHSRANDLHNPPAQSAAGDGETDILPSQRILEGEAPPLESEEMSASTPQNPHITKARAMIGPANIVDIAIPRSAPLAKSTASQPKLHLGNSWMYTCDGCFRDPQDAGEMYFCEVCLNKNYCGDCLAKVKTASLWSRQCDANHTHFRAWPIPSEARDLAAEWVEGEAALKSEWLERLRREWME
jgi:tetratricopeptide (TPR) repeat protein